VVVVLEVEATSEVAITGSRRMMVVDIVVRDRMEVVDMAEVVGTEEDMAVRVGMAEVATLATQLGR
jgi:hypothetical protein